MTDRAGFEALYRSNPDPWRFASSPYERAKYRATVAALPRRRFSEALEVGCSIGVLTAALARRCRRLLAVDIAQAALDQARRRCRGVTGLTFRQAAIPDSWPDRTFDLIVLSEVLYFLSAGEVAGTADAIAWTLRPGGVLLLVNWTGPTDTALTGRQAASLLLRRLGGRVRRVTALERPRYRLEVLARPGSRHA